MVRIKLGLIAENKMIKKLNVTDTSEIIEKTNSNRICTAYVFNLVIRPELGYNDND